MNSKLRVEKGYARHPESLDRVFVRLGNQKQVVSTKKKTKHLGHYETLEDIGIKWQMDVKYVPRACYVGKSDDRFYHVIDEASRERFIYHYREQCRYSTIDFLKRAITYFGYAPNILQTDNGAEFSNFAKTDRM